MNTNFSFWSKKIKSLLEQIGLGDLWIKAHYGENQNRHKFEFEFAQTVSKLLYKLTLF